MSDPRRKGLTHANPRDGRLSPWADTAIDAPGWQITCGVPELGYRS